MTITKLVDRGLELRHQIAVLTKELDDLEEKLLGEAHQGEQVELADKNREGRQFLARGSRFIVPVVFTADKIIGTFQGGSDINLKICRALPEGKSLRTFYDPKTVWNCVLKSGKAFRKLASDELGAAAPQFITACLSRDKDGIPKSDIKIEWDAAKEVV